MNRDRSKRANNVAFCSNPVSNAVYFAPRREEELLQIYPHQAIILSSAVDESLTDISSFPP